MEPLASTSWGTAGGVWQVCEGGDGGAEAICKAEGPQGQPELDGSHIGFGSGQRKGEEV